MATEILERRIREILEVADLNQLSSKKLRLQLEDEFKIDLTDRKKEIDELIISIVEEIETDSKNKDPEQKKVEEEAEKKAKETERIYEDMKLETTQADDQEMEIDSPKKNASKKSKAPPKQTTNSKQKRSQKGKSDDYINSDSDDDKYSEEGDRLLAMQLQNENYSLRRSTNRNSKLINRDQEKKTTKKKKPKGSDDDDEGNSKKKTGFHTPMVLSEPLAALLGTQEISRLQVVKKIWEYVKEKNLQDPNDKRFIICDDKLEAVFKKPRIQMFSMNKTLSLHLKRKDQITS